MARGQYAAALNEYRLQSKPSARTLNGIGLAYYKMLGFDEAQKYFKKAAAQQPGYAIAWSNLGATYFYQGEYGKALRNFVRANSLSPDDPVVLANVGAVSLVLGKYKEALEAYRKAIALDAKVLSPDPRTMVNAGVPSRSPVVNFYLAEVFAMAGKSSEALSYLRKALGAGFRDRKKLMTDADLSSIRSTAAFQQLIAEGR